MTTRAKPKNRIEKTTAPDSPAQRRPTKGAEKPGIPGPSTVEMGDDEPPLTVDDIHLGTRAVREGWLRQRWPTNLTTEQFKESVQGRGMNLMEKIILAAHRKLADGSDRRLIDVMKLGIAMEAQNQRDDLSERGTAPAPPPISNNIQNAQIILTIPDNGRGQ